MGRARSANRLRLGIALSLVFALAGVACGGGGADPTPTPVPTGPPGSALIQNTKRDKFFPVTFVMESAANVTVSLRRIDPADPSRAQIVVEGYAKTSTVYKREFHVRLLDDAGAPHEADQTLALDLQPGDTQRFQRVVDVPRDLHMTHLQFKPVESSVDTKTYVIDLLPDEIPVTSSVALGQ